MSSKDLIRLACLHLSSRRLVHASRCFARGLGILTKEPWKNKEQQANQDIQAKRLDEADTLFSVLLYEYPEQPIGLMGKAKVARARKDWNKALEVLELLRGRFGKVLPPMWQKQYADALMHVGRFAFAEAEFKSLEQKQPEQPWGRIGLAQTAANKEDWIIAMEHWEYCFRTYPDFIQPWWHKQKTRVMVAMGDSRQAQEESRKVHTSPNADAWFSMLADKANHTRDVDGGQLHYDSLLVVSYGRSGSTLLQGILNSINGVLIRGENQNVFRHLYQLIGSLEDTKLKYGGAVLPNQAWFGAGYIDYDAIYKHFQGIARSIILSDLEAASNVHCFGFKEVWYHELGDELENYLNFLSRIFPNPAFIFNTRNLDDVVNSAWWKEQNPDEVRVLLKDVEKRFSEYSAKRSNCFQITYEDITSASSRLESLLAFIGAPYDHQRIDTILSVPHSYSPTQEHVKNLFKEF